MNLSGRLPSFPCVALLAVVANLAAAETVLDLERGSFRGSMGWRTPSVVTAAGAVQPLREPARPDLKDEERKAVPLRESAEPAPGWTAPGFDDGDWCRVRGAAALVQGGADWKYVCLRGAFEVADPAQAQGLLLRVSYAGGIRVLVNGAEVARAHLPAGAPRSDTLAERYPDEAYVRADGKVYAPKDEQDKALAPRLAMRVRRLPAGDDAAAGLPIPSSLLRKGINVLAIESRGAPLGEIALTAPLADRTGDRGSWPHAGVLSARLECASGVTPNVAALPGIRIGNVTPTETLTAWDYVHPAEGLRPVRIAGARNGFFSGRVMLSSTEAIRGLQGVATELAQAGGTAKIPVSAVQVRWAEVAAPEYTWMSEGRFDRLAALPPAEVAPLKAGKATAPGGAVVPVWITVHVPADAAAGDYRGSVTIEAQGKAAAKFTVPVELRVHAWKVPDPSDFTMVNNFCQSPDSVAQYYQVPLWSERHFQLLGRSLDVLHQAGSRLCNLNLIVGMHGYGNSESMVRWVRQDDGTYTHDFTIAEKYMELYARTCGKPQFLQVNAWAFPGDDPSHPKWPPESVTVVDKNGKRLENLQQPPYGTPENEAFWRPVLTALQQRLEKRGWWDVTCIGWLAYQNAPDRKLVEVASHLWPDRPWIKNAHAVDKKFQNMPVKCNAWVWGCGAPYNPDCETRWGQRPLYAAEGRMAYPQPWAAAMEYISIGIPRWGTQFVHPGLYGHGSLMRYRRVSEAALQGNVRGLGQVGGDFWPVTVGEKGRLGTICGSQGAVTPKVTTLALTCPGPDGAVFSERLEMFREGLQVAEAIIALQKAVLEKRASDDQARRIKLLLDERARDHLHNQNSLLVGPGHDPCTWLSSECLGWQARDAALLALAGEVVPGGTK